MSFPEKIRTLRKLNKLSQEKLAEIMNVSRQAIAKWELGKSYPDIDKLIEISNYFNISIDSLLKEKNNDCNLKKNITKIGEYKMDKKIVEFLCRAMPGQVIRRIIVFHFPSPLPVFHPAPNAAPADSVARAVDTGRPAPTVAYGSPFP